MGSKSRIAKHIAPILQDYIDKNNIKHYTEPFAGGCNIIDKIKCENRYGYDINPYLIALLIHVSSGEELPETINREEYNAVRTDFNNCTNEYPDWYIGCVGFLASYNGRFFDGGYAQSGYEKTKHGERYRDYYRESKDNLLAQAPMLEGVWLATMNYKYLGVENQLIYCDPPYQNTKQYGISKGFDYNEFWDIMRKWSKNNIVVVSELNAPSDFICIWQQEVSRSIKTTDKSKAVEKLFVLEK